MHNAANRISNEIVDPAAVDMKSNSCFALSFEDVHETQHARFYLLAILLLHQKRYEVPRISVSLCRAEHFFRCVKDIRSLCKCVPAMRKRKSKHR